MSHCIVLNCSSYQNNVLEHLIFYLLQLTEEYSDIRKTTTVGHDYSTQNYRTSAPYTKNSVSPEGVEIVTGKTPKEFDSKDMYGKFLCCINDFIVFKGDQ